GCYMISSRVHSCLFLSFFLSAPPTSALYTLSLHDALPIFGAAGAGRHRGGHAHRGHDAVCVLVAIQQIGQRLQCAGGQRFDLVRSEEHTSELQSRENLVCRLLLEKKKTKPPS